MLLTCLHNLLYSWLPVILLLGHWVRQLTWEGGVDGTIKGDKARVLLLRALAAQVQLLQDWQCETEYCRTLSVALLQWQPWMSTLPGCCFVEESCEALLSRMVGRCRANTSVCDYDGTNRLFVTLPLPSREPRGTTGSLSPDMVTLFLSRVRRIIHSADSLPFAKVLSATDARWDLAPPPNFHLPGPLQPPECLSTFDTVLQGAVVNLAGGRAVLTDALKERRDNLVPLVVGDDAQHAALQGALAKVRQWATERRQSIKERKRLQMASGQQSQDTASQGLPSADDGGGHAHAGQEEAPADQDSMAQSSRDPLDLYYPPGPEDMQLSEGFPSYGDTDSLGSVGQLQAETFSEWEEEVTGL